MEAIAAGFAVAMRADDYTFCTYRGHAHTLARGAPMAAVMAELLGREQGLMGGKGGSMHLTSVAHGVMGSYAIVGAHLPIAAGAAWRQRIPVVAKTAVKDVREWARAKAFRIDASTWRDHDVAFVWQRHELFQTVGPRLAAALGVPSVLFVPAPLMWQAGQWGVRAW